MAREVPLSRGYVAIVDDDDYETVMAAGPWHVDVSARSIHAARNLRRPDGSWGRQRMHTLLTGWPLVDHRDGDGLNNRMDNLRPATCAQNSANQARPVSNTSGYKGVSWRKRDRRWYAYIKVNGKQCHLGSYATAQDAAHAYDAAAIAAWGEYARPNFPYRGDGHA